MVMVLGWDISPTTSPTLLLSLAPDLHFPCGTPAENLGMAGPGRPGEWLVRRVAADPVMILHGTPWSSAGSSARVNLPIPLDPSLLGTSLYVQGFLLDPAQTFGVRVGLTDAMKLIVGP